MLNFIVNPHAGTFKGKKLKKTLKKLEDHLAERNVPYTIHKTNHKGHATTLTRNLIDTGATDIIAIGGDGTLHEILNGFHSFDKCNLGLIPCGTGNDFAGTLNISKDPVKALDLILDGEPKYIDYLQTPTVRGINVIGAGLDVVVLEHYEKLKRKTKLGYTMCLLKTLFGFKGITFECEVDGEKKTYNSFIAAIANGTRFGGGIQICPSAIYNDGKINFVAVDFVKGLPLVGLLLKLNSGKILQAKGATEVSAEKVKITGESISRIQIDGELYPGDSLEVWVVSNQLKMYRP